MDKAAYLRKKEEQKQSIIVYKREEFCFNCFRLRKNCLCHLIKPFGTQTQFVLLMHPMEAKKEKLGTGRITLACLKNSHMIMGVDFTDDPAVNALIKDPNNHCMVLYPGEKSLNISSDDIAPIKNLNDKRLVIFLIDGTWPCAKKMMKLSKNINTLPRISFNSNRESLFVIKEQPAEFCLSTLESIHCFLSECEKRGLETLNYQHDNMIDVFKEMVSFQVKCALDPELNSYRKSSDGYSLRDDRKKSKKWNTRRIIHRD